MTTATKAMHTPGPWTAEHIPASAHSDPDMRLPEEFVFWIAELRVAGEVLAVVEQNSRNEAEANARLIAAAPEMYNALREVAHHADDECGFMALVRAAIAKAESM